MTINSSIKIVVLNTVVKNKLLQHTLYQIITYICIVK